MTADAAAWDALRRAREASGWDELAEHLETIELFRERYPKSEASRKLSVKLRPIEDRRPWMKVRRLIPENQVTGEMQWPVVREVASHLTSEGLRFETLSGTSVNTDYGEALKDPGAERGLPMALKGRVLKLAYEDLKAYYGEAITAQPGYVSSLQVENWLFNDTVFGKMLWTLRSICRASDNEYYQYLGGNSIVPDRQVELIERTSQVLE